MSNTPTASTEDVPQSPLSLGALAVIEQNVREQLSIILGASCIRANLNAGCYVGPCFEAAAKECIDKTLAKVIEEVVA